MGISSSTPECPPCSPDIGQIGDGGMPSMSREPCHESSPPRKAVTRPCSPRVCERGGSESPVDRRSCTSPPPYCAEEEEEEEEEDDTDCYDDDEEEECDDDEDDDECEEDDEEVNEESEEQDETCSSSNVFTPCRDPVPPRSDISSDELDCSENVLGEKRETEETPVRKREEKALNDEPISQGRSPRSRYPPCGQSTPQRKSPKFDPSPRRPQEDQSIPQRNSPKRIFSPCREGKPSATPQRSRSPSPSSSDKMRREKSPARQDRCIATPRVDVPKGRGKLNSPEQRVQSRGSQAARAGADPYEKPPNKQRGNESCDSSKADYSKKENQTAPSCEEIKELQKGSAYLSKKEIRKVCDKYQRYGNFTDSESEGHEESNSTGMGVGNAYTLGFFKGFQDNSISPCSVSFEDRSKEDYSGGSKPCSPAVKSDLKGNVVKLADAGSMQTCVTLQGATQLSGGKCKSPYSDRNCRSRERKASPARKSSPNAYRGSPGRRATSRCRSHSPKKYTITCSRPSTDQFTGLISTTTTAATAAAAEHNKSDSNNSCWPKQTAQPHDNEGFETLQGLSDSNSNNLDDIDASETSNSDGGNAVERIHSTSSVSCQPEQAVMDEMWFECWEADTLAGREQSENKATVSSYSIRNQMFNNGNDMGTFQSFAMPGPNDSIMQEIFASEHIEGDLPFIKSNTERSAAKAGGLPNTAKDKSTLVEEKREDGKKGKNQLYISMKKNHSDIISELMSAKMPAYARSRSLLHTLTKKLGAQRLFENMNSNADSLIHIKKKSSHTNLGQSSSRGTPKKGQSSSDLQGKPSGSSISHLQTSRDKMTLQGKLIFDTDLASKMGLGDTQIEQLINTIPVCGEPKSSSAKECNQSIVGIDPAQKMAPGTQQAHQSDDTSTTGTSFQPRLFSVDLAQRMGLSLRQIQQLIDSTCKENYIKYILLIGETAFDPELAISMGLNREEVKVLADSSRLVNGKKRLPQAKSSSASEYFDANLARQIGLSENQIKLLVNSIQSRMHSQPVFDPDLAIKMGLSTKQIKQLGESLAQTNRTFNVAVAKKMGLTDAQIQQLIASSVQVSPTSSGLILHNPDLNRAHDFYTQGVNQSNPFSSQISRRNSDLLKPTYQSYPDGDGWTRKTLGQRRQQLVYKLQVSMAGGNEVTNVLTTLIEWNSILLVVIFLLLLGTSCPGLARSILPCPLPSACEALHRFVISPLGLDQILGQWTEPSSPHDSDEPAIWTYAWESVSGNREKSPPKGIVYSGLYRLGRACVVTFGEVLSFAIFRVITPLVSAPFTLGEALIRLIYSSLLCTVRSGIYAIFYLSGAVLGIPVPSTPPYVEQEGKANAPAPPKGREYSAQRPAFAKEKASQPAPLEQPVVAGDTSSVPQVPPGQPVPTEADEMPPAPFNPDQPGALTPDLHELHQHGGFFIYMGFDPPKKGCNYSSITTTLLWLLWALPEECA